MRKGRLILGAEKFLLKQECYRGQTLRLPSGTSSSLVVDLDSNTGVGSQTRTSCRGFIAGSKNRANHQSDQEAGRKAQAVLMSVLIWEGLPASVR